VERDHITPEKNFSAARENPITRPTILLHVCESMDKNDDLSPCQNNLLYIHICVCACVIASQDENRNPLGVYRIAIYKCLFNLALHRTSFLFADKTTRPSSKLLRIEHSNEDRASYILDSIVTH
jgi:hypothetical protein